MSFSGSGAKAFAGATGFKAKVVVEKTTTKKICCFLPGHFVLAVVSLVENCCLCEFFDLWSEPGPTCFRVFQDPRDTILIAKPNDGNRNLKKGVSVFDLGLVSLTQILQAK